MKRFITILFLAIALSLIANAQEECKVPISVQLTHISHNTMKNRYDRRWMYFSRILERNGFTSEVHNTRVAIALVTNLEKEHCGVTNRKISVEIQFIDSYSGSVFYSTELDNSYCGKYHEMEEKLADDLSSPMPELDSLADSIRTCIINAYEVNTKHMAELAHEYAAQGDHDIALFALTQYPPCCKSFPKIKNMMLAIFRDYMKKDHDALLDLAKDVWRYEESDTDARFVVSLLNSVKFTEREQRKADRLFKKIAKEYPTLDLKANVDYVYDPVLKEVAYREARAIGIEYSTSDKIFPETKHTVPSSFSSMRYEYYHNRDYYDYDYYDYYDDWYPSMMDTYMFME